MTEPRAFSRASVKWSANKASSAMLPKMIFESSRDMGGLAVEPLDESDTVEAVRDEEPDDFGGVVGIV